eukprot:448741-Rhodomonas_salina.1
MEDYLISNPMAPPCLAKIRVCRNVCEYSAPCRAVGGCGTQWGSENRQKLFVGATAVAVLALIFSSVAVAGVTHDTTVLKNVYWAKGSGTLRGVGGVDFQRDFTIYIGLTTQVVDVKDNGNTVFTNKTWWSDVNCLGPQCEDCKTQAGSMVTGAIMALVTCLPTIQTNIQRSQSKWDMNCQKFLAQFMANGIGFIGTLLALSSFASGCYENLPDSITTCNEESGVRVCGTASDIKWSLGPGFILILIATLLKIIDLVVNCLVPTPPHCRKIYFAGNELPEQEQMDASPESPNC